jgi:hypothetical protein
VIGLAHPLVAPSSESPRSQALWSKLAGIFAPEVFVSPIPFRRRSHAHSERQRQRPRVRSRARHAAACGCLREQLRPHGNEVRLRHRAMRRVHRAPRRRADTKLRAAGLVARGRRQDRHDRRALARRFASGPESMGCARRPAMRVLPVRE